MSAASRKSRIVVLVALLALFTCLIVWFVHRPGSTRVDRLEPDLHAHDATSTLGSGTDAASPARELVPAAVASTARDDAGRNVRDPTLDLLILRRVDHTPVAGALVRCARKQDLPALQDHTHSFARPDIETLLAPTPVVTSDANGI